MEKTNKQTKNQKNSEISRVRLKHKRLFFFHSILICKEVWVKPFGFYERPTLVR